jgi:hypothetical protein
MRRLPWKNDDILSLLTAVILSHASNLEPNVILILADALGPDVLEKDDLSKPNLMMVGELRAWRQPADVQLNTPNPNVNSELHRELCV